MVALKRASMLAALVLLMLLQACTPEEAASGVQGDVVVEVRGKLVSSSTAGGTDFSGVTITVVRVSSSARSAQHVAPVNPGGDGAFAIPDVAMTPWEETYAIDVRDSKGLWQPRSLTLFSLTSGVVDYKEIALSPITGEIRSRVTGVLRDAITLEAVEGVSLRMVDSARSYDAKSAADGSFELRVPASRYRLEIDTTGLKSSTAASGWVSEMGQSARVVNVPAEPELPLGRLLLAPATEGDGVTLILSTGGADGDPRALALARECETRVLSELSADGKVGFTALSLPPPEFDINHAHGLTLERWEADGLLRPDGFGAGTSFWPSFLGSQVTSTTRHPWDATRLVVGRGLKQMDATGDGADKPLDLRAEDYKVGERTLIRARSVTLANQRIESLVIQEQNLMSAFPKKLAYFYRTGGTTDGLPPGVEVTDEDGNPVDGPIPGGGGGVPGPSGEPDGGFPGPGPGEPPPGGGAPPGDGPPPGDGFPPFDAGAPPGDFPGPDDGPPPGDFPFEAGAPGQPPSGGDDPFGPPGGEPVEEPRDNYPAGMMLQSIRVECWERAEVRAYQNNALLGTYQYERTKGSGASATWSPLLVEYGFTEASPAKDEDVYLRVLPTPDLDLQGAEPVQGYEAAEVRKVPEGWTSLPSDISFMGGTAGRIYFSGIGTGSTSKQLWWLERNAKPGQDAAWPSTATVLAVYSDAAGSIMATRDGSQVKILQQKPDGTFQTLNANFDTATCGTPNTLGRLSKTWIVGTDKGLFTTHCTQQAEGVDGDLIKSNYTRKVITFARFRAARVKGDWVFIGTNEGVYAANLAGGLFESSEEYQDLFDASMVNCDPGALIPGETLPPQCGDPITWNEVKPAFNWDIASGKEPTVALASLGNDFLYASARALYLDFGPDAMSGQPTIKRAIFIPDLIKRPDGSSLDTSVSALATFGGNVYLGTNYGAFKVDLVGAAACPQSDTSSSDCLSKAITRLEGFPQKKIISFVTGANRFFALTEVGLFELRSTRPQIGDPTTTTPIEGLDRVLDSPDGGIEQPPADDDAGSTDLDSGTPQDEDGGSPPDLDAGMGDVDAGDNPACGPEFGSCQPADGCPPVDCGAPCIDNEPGPGYVCDCFPEQELVDGKCVETGGNGGGNTGGGGNGDPNPCEPLPDSCEATDGCGNPVNCGLGSCVNLSPGYECQCDANALLLDNTCIPIE